VLQRAAQKALDAREGRIEIEVAAGEGAAA
jgi:hypothetical protein